MCTAVAYMGNSRFFGRNLDFECTFGEEVVQTPSGFSFPFGETVYTILGMAHMEEGIPLYYDGMNEKGLAMAGLLFSGYAVYGPLHLGQENIPSWAVIPWVLGQCATVEEAKRRLTGVNITREPFRKDLPPSPLHWMITDGKDSLVVEATVEGLQLYENPAGILTNNPPFPFHQENLRQYLHLTAGEPKNHFSERMHLTAFSRGAGAFGLPGDWSSASRFIRAAFVKENAPQDGDVLQLFHILGTVEMPLGCVRLGKGQLEKTIYTACCDLERGIYYYKTYDDFRIRAISMKKI